MSWIEDEVTKRKNKATMAEIERLRSNKQMAVMEAGISRLVKLLLEENSKLPEQLRLVYKEAIGGGFGLFDKRYNSPQITHTTIGVAFPNWGHISYDTVKEVYVYKYYTDAHHSVTRISLTTLPGLL